MKRFMKYCKYFVPVISLVLAFFIAFPSSAAASVIRAERLQTSFTVAPNIRATVTTTPYQLKVTSGTTTITSNRGSDTVVFPFNYVMEFFPSNAFPSTNFPSGTSSVWLDLPYDYRFDYAVHQLSGNTTHTFSFNFNLTFYLVSVTGQEVPLFTMSTINSSGQRNVASYFDIPSGIDSTISRFFSLEVRGEVLLSGFSSGSDTGIFELEFIPYLTCGARSYQNNIVYWSGSAPSSGGDIDDLQNSITNDINNQTDTITDGYDNSGLNSSGNDLSNSVNDYDNIESNLMTNVDFSDVELTDAFSLPAFVNTTTLYTSFLQGIYTNLGDAGIIVICSLCIAFAFALIGYRKYLDRGGG